MIPEILATLITVLEVLTVSVTESYEIPEIYMQEPELMRVTCYTWTGNKTASGCYPYEGICASNEENLGKVALVYDKEMVLIGIYEIKDTGSAESLKNGTSIDIYFDTLEDCENFIKEHGDYQYVRIID